MDATEFSKANERIFIKAMSEMTDSQFLAWTAMAIDANGDSFNRMIAARLDRIALLVGANEAIEVKR